MKRAPAAMNMAAVGASMIVPDPRITSGSSATTRRESLRNVSWAKSPRFVNSTTVAPPSAHPATIANAASTSGALKMWTAPLSRIARRTVRRSGAGIGGRLLGG